MSTYWENSGKHQELYNSLYKRLVPDMGEADTKAGEVLRAISKLYYDSYNNGCGNFELFTDHFSTLDFHYSEFIKLAEDPKLVNQSYSQLKNHHLDMQEDPEVYDCIKCNGEGVVEEDYFDDNEEEECREITCPECHGDCEIQEEYSCMMKFDENALEALTDTIILYVSKLDDF